MARPFKTLRERMEDTRSSASASGSSFGAHWNALAVWLGVVAQVGVLALGWYGYVHTVLPIYSKELLEEEIANKELELRNLRSDVVIATNERRALIGQIAQLEEQRILSEQTLSTAETRAIAAEFRAVSATRRVRAAEEFGRVTALRQKLLMRFAERAESSCSAAPLKTRQDFVRCMTSPLTDANEETEFQQEDRDLLMEWINYEAAKASSSANYSVDWLACLAESDPGVGAVLVEGSPVRSLVETLSGASEARYAISNAVRGAFQKVRPDFDWLKRPRAPNCVRAE